MYSVYTYKHVYDYPHEKSPDMRLLPRSSHSTPLFGNLYATNHLKKTPCRGVKGNDWCQCEPEWGWDLASWLKKSATQSTPIWGPTIY